MAEFIAARDLRAGQTIVWKNSLYLILDHSFNKTAMRVGIVKCKVKNLENSVVTTEDFSNQKFEKAIIETIPVVFSYSDDKFLYFLDSVNFNEYKLEIDSFRNFLKFLEAGLELSIGMYKEKVVNFVLPDIVPLTIDKLEAEGGSSDHKKATTSSGLVVSVPKFCNVGDRILVSSLNGKYKSR